MEQPKGCIRQAKLSPKDRICGRTGRVREEKYEAILKSEITPLGIRFPCHSAGLTSLHKSLPLAT